MAWQHPKTNWQPNNPVGAADLNRIEENILELQNSKQMLGTANTDVNKVVALEHKIDTRAIILTYADGNLIRVEEKHGAMVVKTTNLQYDDDGNLITVVETAGGVAVTTNFNYTDGNLTSVTRAVS